MSPLFEIKCRHGQYDHIILGFIYGFKISSFLLLFPLGSGFCICLLFDCASLLASLDHDTFAFDHRSSNLAMGTDVCPIPVGELFGADSPFLDFTSSGFLKDGRESFF